MQKPHWQTWRSLRKSKWLWKSKQALSWHPPGGQKWFSCITMCNTVLSFPIGWTSIFFRRNTILKHTWLEVPRILSIKKTNQVLSNTKNTKKQNNAKQTNARTNRKQSTQTKQNEKNIQHKNPNTKKKTDTGEKQKKLHPNQKNNWKIQANLFRELQQSTRFFAGAKIPFNHEVLTSKERSKNSKDMSFNSKGLEHNPMI